MKTSSTKQTPTSNKPSHMLSVIHTTLVARWTLRPTFGIDKAGQKTQNQRPCAHSSSSRSSGLHRMQSIVGVFSGWSNKHSKYRLFVPSREFLETSPRPALVNIQFLAQTTPATASSNTPPAADHGSGGYFTPECDALHPFPNDAPTLPTHPLSCNFAFIL